MNDRKITLSSTQLSAHSSFTAPVHYGTLFDLRTPPTLQSTIQVHSIINPLLALFLHAVSLHLRSTV